MIKPILPTPGEEELWHSIPKYEGRYEASTFGRIRSSKSGRVLKLNLNGGYFCIGLMREKKEKRRVNRLIAQTFKPNPRRKAVVNHLDGNKLNNYYKNLAWATHKENSHHAHQNGLTKYPLAKPYVRKTDDKGYVYAHSKPVDQFTRAGLFVATFPTIKAAAESVQTGIASIANVLVNRRGKKTSKGFIWRYHRANHADKIRV